MWLLKYCNEELREGCMRRAAVIVVVRLDIHFFFFSLMATDFLLKESIE